MSRIIVCVALVFGVASDAAAQPGAAINLSANPARSLTFSWPAVATATYYYLWITDVSGVPRHQRWYTSEELTCGAGQTATCQISLATYLLPGDGTWWVQTWNPAGYGPWTSAQTFGVPGPLYAVISDLGVLARGNAVSSQRLVTGNYEVIFARDVTDCAFQANLGGTDAGSPIGAIVTTTRRSGNPRGVFIYITNFASATIDKSFHLSVTCP